MIAWYLRDKPDNTFPTEPELAPYWKDPFFRRPVQARVRFALTRYFYRKSQVADISSFVIWVPLGDGKRIFLEKKFLSCDRI